MKIKKEQIPATMESPGTTMRGLPGYGDMTIAFNELPDRYRFWSFVARIKK